MSVESVAKNFITRCWVSTVSIITDVVTEVLTTFTISDCKWCNEQRCPQKTVKRNHESDDRTQFSLQGQFELHHCLSKAGALVIVYTIKLANVGNSGTASVTSSTTCVSNEKERRKKLKVPVVNIITRKKTKKKKPKNKGKELSHYSNFQLDAESNSRLLYTAMWLVQRPYATLSNNQMQS